MTPDVVSGLSAVVVLTVASCLLVPILAWVLPDRRVSATSTVES